MFKEHKFNNFSYLWKSQADLPNSLVEILFEKRKRYKECMGSLTVFATQQFSSFWLPIFPLLMIAKS